MRNDRTTDPRQVGDPPADLAPPVVPVEPDGRRVERILLENVSFPQTFVRAWALDGLATLAERRVALIPIVRKHLRAFERSSSKALHARARQIRARLGSS